MSALKVGSQIITFGCAIFILSLNILRAVSYEVSIATTITQSVFEVVFLVGLVLAIEYLFQSGLQAGIPLVVAVSVVFTSILRRKYVCGKRFDSSIDLSGKVYIVTGSNTGIGYETVKALVKMNATAVMACRSLDKATAAKQAIVKETGVSESKIICIKLDLCGFDSVRKFVKMFRDLNLPLHGLINNAGVMLDSRNLTQDGFEMVFTANHLSHFLLTNLLLPDLEKTSGRVVVVASSMHFGVKEFDFEDVMAERTYSLFGTYSQSKLANVLFAFELQKRLTAKGSKVTCNTLHPGMVSTEVTRHMSAFMRVGEAMAAPILRLLRKTPPEGAYTQVYAATAPELEGKGGLYLLHCEESPVSAGARDAVAGERLWKLSEKLTGLVH